MNISYTINQDVKSAEVIILFDNSGIRRPTNDVDRIGKMFKNVIKIDNDSQATTLVSYRIKFPSKMPPSYNLQFGMIETVHDNNKFVILFYSKDTITDAMRANEFFAQKGIAIYYRKEESDPRKEGGFEFHIRDYLCALQRDKVEASEVTINGHKGIVSSQRDRLFHGVEIHDPSQVEFVMKETHITIQGYLEKEDLIRIAESIE